MEVGTLVRRGAAHVADHLATEHALTFGHRRVVEGRVDRVVPAAVVEDDGHQVGAERLRQHHRAGGHGLHGRARHGRDADAVPDDGRVVGSWGRAELVDQATVDGPVEGPQAALGDRGGACRRTARQRRPPRPLEGGDHVDQPALLLLLLGETSLGFPHAAPRGREVRLPPVGEVDVAQQLARALGLASPQGVARVHQRLPLPRDAVLQLGHVVGEQPILLGHQKEVFVARQQVAEALGGEQHLVGVEGAALGDVHQPALEHGALFGEGVLGEDQVHRHLIDLEAEPADLAVQLVHDAVGGVALALQIGDLVGDRVGLGAQPLQLLLDR